MKTTTTLPPEARKEHIDKSDTLPAILEKNGLSSAKVACDFSRVSTVHDNRPVLRCIAECIGHSYADRPRPDGPLSL
ncbi:MAG: hypothetical protein K2L45_09240 [Muribaculaceae bacterium]|nr:hypothetical protein [Muribaculaceae bacterium]